MYLGALFAPSPIVSTIFAAQTSFHKSFPKDIKICVIKETHQILTRKGGSQDLKRRQVSNAFGNGARQIIRTEVSAPEYTCTSWVRCQFQCSPHQVCIAFGYLFSSHPPLAFESLHSKVFAPTICSLTLRYAPCP